MRYRQITLAALVATTAALAAPGAPAAGGNSPSASASDRDCSDFRTQREAQDYFLRLGGPGSDPDRLDGDGDGSACDSLPCPCGGAGDDGQRRAEAKRRAAKRRAARRRAAERREAERERAFRRRIDRAPARVIDVIDGDTVKVKAGGRSYTVRVLGIDTPETRKPGTAVECGGREATSNTLSLTYTAPTDSDGDGLLDTEGGEGVRVDLTTDPTQDVTDKFGRLLAYIDVPAGARGPEAPGYDLGRSVIGAGYSRTYTFDKRVRRYARYIAAEADAREADRGVWGLCGGEFHSER